MANFHGACALLLGTYSIIGYRWKVSYKEPHIQQNHYISQLIGLNSLCSKVMSLIRHYG